MNAIRLSTRALFALVLCAAFALILSACAAPDNTNATVSTGNGNTTATTTTTTTTAPAAPAASAPATAAANTAPAGEKIGIEECDDFLAKYEKCLDSLPAQVPEAARAQWKTSLAQTRESWHKLAATPQGKASLTQACKSMRDTTKQAMAAYNCTF